MSLSFWEQDVFKQQHVSFIFKLFCSASVSFCWLYFEHLYQEAFIQSEYESFYVLHAS